MTKKLMTAAMGLALAGGVTGAGLATAPGAQARGCTNCVVTDDGWGGGIVAPAGARGGGIVTPQGARGGGLLADRSEPDRGWCHVC